MFVATKLLDYMFNCIGARPHYCDAYDNQITKAQYNYDVNIVVHKLRKSHACGYCGSTNYPVGMWCQNNVVSTSMRHDHVDVDTTSFFVMCPLGTLAQHLKVYRLIYTEEGPHSCYDCSKKLTQCYLLQEHKLFHTDRMHLCEFCGQGYTQA